MGSAFLVHGALSLELNNTPLDSVEPLSARGMFWFILHALCSYMAAPLRALFPVRSHDHSTVAFWLR